MRIEILARSIVGGARSLDDGDEVAEGARAVAGFSVDGDGILKAEDFHDWAEVMFGDAWAVADPQKKVFMSDTTKYIAMRIIGDSPGSPMGNAHRFRTEGRGLAVKMN